LIIKTNIKILIMVNTKQIDWLEDFIEKFKGNFLVRTLKMVKFHGKLEINFCDGIPNTVHLNWCVKPYSEVSSNCSTLKGGE